MENKDSQGFSLVEMLVSISILSIILMTLISSFTFNLKSQKHYQQTIDYTELKRTIRMVLSKQSICHCNFYGKQIPEIGFGSALISISEINFFSDTTCSAVMQNVAKANVKYGSISVSSISLKNFSQVGTSASFLAELEVVVDASGTIGASQYVDKFPLLFTVDPPVSGNYSINGCVTP